MTTTMPREFSPLTGAACGNGGSEIVAHRASTPGERYSLTEMREVAVPSADKMQSTANSMPQLLAQLQSSKVSNPLDVADAMENLLKPVDVEWLAVRVTEFRKGFFNSDRGDAGQTLSMVDWMNALKIYPSWAIEQAIINYNQTETGGFPKPADLAVRANSRCAIFRKVQLEAQRQGEFSFKKLSPYDAKERNGFMPGSAPALRDGELTGKELANKQACEAVASESRGKHKIGNFDPQASGSI